MNAYAVIDIGGTAIKYGCATEEGQFLEKASCPTQAREGGIPEKVIAIVQDMASRHALVGVAIDTAGIVRPGEDGEIVFRHSLALPHGERPTLAQAASMIDAAVDPRIFEPVIIRPIAGNPPAESRGKEGAALRPVRRGKLDIVDLVSHFLAPFVPVMF